MAKMKQSSPLPPYYRFEDALLLEDVYVQTLDLLKKEVANLRDQLKSSESQCSQLSSKCSFLESKTVQLQEENADLQTKLVVPSNPCADPLPPAVVPQQDVQMLKEKEKSITLLFTLLDGAKSRYEALWNKFSSNPAPGSTQRLLKKEVAEARAMAEAIADKVAAEMTEIPEGLDEEHVKAVNVFDPHFLDKLEDAVSQVPASPSSNQGDVSFREVHGLPTVRGEKPRSIPVSPITPATNPIRDSPNKPMVKPAAPPRAVIADLPKKGPAPTAFVSPVSPGSASGTMSKGMSEGISKRIQDLQQKQHSPSSRDMSLSPEPASSPLQTPRKLSPLPSPLSSYLVSGSVPKLSHH